MASMTPLSTPPIKRMWYSPRSIARSLAMRPRVVLGLLTGLAGLALLPLDFKPSVRAALAWNLGALVYLVLALRLMIRFSSERIRVRAARADDGGQVVLALVLVAVLSSLAAIAGLAGEAHEAPKTEKHFYLLLAAATLGSAWLVTQVVFAIHYAHLYYARAHQSPGGSQPMVFPGETVPDYWDFLYFSTSIGATSQTSDVSIVSRQIRRVATLHAVLSFVFNTMVLAVTINIAAGLL